MNISDLTTLYSNANWIDALISADSGRVDLNPLAVSRSDNTVSYTFEVSATAGLEREVTADTTYPFNSVQRAAAREIMDHAAAVTGINFVESASGSADILFGYCDIWGAASTSGKASRNDYWRYAPDSGRITSYTTDRGVFLDNNEWAFQNANPVKGTQGYETLLHEIGHALGLQHPFEAPFKLPTSADNTDNSVMSYTDGSGGFKSTFQEYDISALVYLYGIDGLAGDYGVDGAVKYYSGTSHDESFSGGWESAAWDGQGGNDSLTLLGSTASYTYEASGDWLTATSNGVSQFIHNTIETIGFDDGSYSYSGLRALALGDGSLPGASETQWGIAGIENRFTGSAGDDTIIGAELLDAITYWGERSRFIVTRVEEDIFQLIDGSGSYGTDRLEGIERVIFSDGAVALDVDIGETAGQAYRIYKAAFDRSPDIGGLSYWIGVMDNGTLITEVARNFLESLEFRSLYGANLTNTDYIEALYSNVLDRQYDQGGFDFWVASLDAGSLGRADVLAGFAESSENQLNVIGAIEHGIDYLT
ncbi:Serralysin precursor [Thiorhodovibrio winogradskyi]|uniref:Serralysin n=1 Tax=Thiorhodovibrio winogradskyi TaxID=77007 RepID=A0ABZ0SDR8_9GAMM|nr:DUF4214 domain-containing protein [Thiorhodovibrio winogradskyi]